MKKENSIDNDGRTLIRNIVKLAADRVIINDAIEIVKSHMEESASEYLDSEWRRYDRACIKHGNVVHVNVIPEDIQRFKNNLEKLHQATMSKNLHVRDNALEDLVHLGQETLRNKYLATFSYPRESVKLSEGARILVDAGTESIHQLGRAPAAPRVPYYDYKMKFHGISQADMGIEILSSGAFPETAYTELIQFLDENDLKMGFENMINAVLASPRARALSRAKSEGYVFNPLDLPIYLRCTMDLELMRLGQATTPGTLEMLLDSHYRGALIANYATNVSEQVQLIYNAEKWKRAFTVKDSGSISDRALEVAKEINIKVIRHKDNSLTGDPVPCEALVDITSLEDQEIAQFLKELLNFLDSGFSGDDEFPPRDPAVHKVTPIFWVDKRFEGTPIDDEKILAALEKIVHQIHKGGFDKLYILSEKIYPRPGLAQYFSDSRNVQTLTKNSLENKVRIFDGRFVDLTATANKAIEAVSGSIESGQSCIKIGLLGLTMEQMKDFIRLVKIGVEEKRRKSENQRLIFIGILDELLVDDRGSVVTVIEDAMLKARAFIELMREMNHHTLLIDTMHKGPKEKKLINIAGRPGYFNYDELKAVVRFAKENDVDLWIAGSITEDQIYECSKMEPEARPSLICIGGAERSFGGIRLEPSQAIDRETNPAGAAKVAFHSDIKYFLSSENKLARDAGHVVGLLLRSGKHDEVTKLEKMRKDYQSTRTKALQVLKENATKADVTKENVDELISKSDLIVKAAGSKSGEIKDHLQKMQEKREEYFTGVSDYFHELFVKKWFPKRF